MIEGARYFDQAIEVFDTSESGSNAQAGNGTVSFAESGRSMGLWLLGHALHHVEDMASVAHVQNDSHMPHIPFVTIYDLNSTDVFEQQYVPTLLGAAGCPAGLQRGRPAGAGRDGAGAADQGEQPGVKSGPASPVRGDEPSQRLAVRGQPDPSDIQHVGVSGSAGYGPHGFRRVAPPTIQPAAPRASFPR